MNKAWLSSTWISVTENTWVGKSGASRMKNENVIKMKGEEEEEEDKAVN